PDHIGGVAELGAGTGAPVYVPRGEAVVLERPDDFYSALGFHVEPYTEALPLEGTETLDVGGVSFETLPVPGHSPGHVAYYVDGSPSPATCSSPAAWGGPTSRAATGTRCSSRFAP